MNRLTAAPALAFFLPPVFFCSCATIMNGPAQNVHIASSPAIKQVLVSSRKLSDSGAAAPGTLLTFVVPRRKEDLVVQLQLDSGVKKVVLRPQNSFAFWFNIYANYGIGLLVDLNNPQRYGYPGWNYFYAKGGSIRWKRFEPIPAGTWRLVATLPVISSYNMRSPEGHQLSGGALALEAGLEYFYKENRYFSLSGGAGTDGGPEHIGRGYYDNVDVLYTSFRNNYVIGSFDLGYGLSVSNMQWRQVANGDTLRTDQSANNTALGLSLSAQYRLGAYFRMGILYQPALLSTNVSPAFDYQHLFSLQLAWKIPFGGGRHK